MVYSMEYNSEYRDNINNRDGDGQRNERMPERNEIEGRRGRRMERNTMNMGESSGRMDGKGRAESKNYKEVEEMYKQIDERMCQALCFHEQLADYFCFLGLQGFKRMAEYQYMKECAGKRKLHRRYIDMHNKILPTEDYRKPVMIPKEWSKHTRHDIDDSVIPKYVRMALKEWYEWERDTKETYEDVCEQFREMNMIADEEFLKQLILDVEKECKKIMRIYENLNGTGYDVTQIHGMQDKLHEKYKKKYDDRFTVKNNYRHYDRQVPEYPMTRPTIGY